MFDIVFGDAAADADVQPAVGQNIEYAALCGEAHGIVEGQDADQIAEAKSLGLARQRRGYQVGRGQHAVVRVMVLGEPRIAKAHPLGQKNLFE